jgi:hypothetical protein
MGEKNDSKNIVEYCKNKLFLILSLPIQSKYFTYSNEFNKKAFNNTIESLKLLSGENINSYISNLEDLFSILPDNSEFKPELISEVLKNQHCLGSVQRMMYNISRENYSKENLIKILSQVGEVCRVNKNYKIFDESNNNYNIINMRIREIVKSQIELNAETVRIYFYITFNNLIINNLKSDLLNLKNLLDKFSLSNESALVDKVMKNDIKVQFEDLYGFESSKY